MTTIEELNVQEKLNFVNGISRPNIKSTWAKQAEVIEEPYVCSPLQNLLLYFPECVSADESGNRLFLSDSNHHRVIVSDGNGKILDSIGSGPGFEDGEFESAKLARPAASFYDDDEDCLYIVDSENHAIRRADLESRVLETVYPKSVSKKNNSIWTWIMDKLGFRINVDARSEEFDSQPLLETLWVIDLVSGEMKECVKGFPNILETCGQLITGQVSLLKQLPNDYLKQQTDVNCSQEFPYATLISNLTTFENDIVLCDTGRVDIRLNIDIPVDTELVEPLQEGCIWRQARGAAAVILGAKDVVGSSEKAGVSQQWYDELDNLAFSTPGLEMAIEEDDATSDVQYQDERLHIDCAVNTSPGTSELIIYAALYLKLRGHLDPEEDGHQKYAARIADILNPGRGEGMGKNSCTQLLLKSNCNLRDLIFVRPLHMRINLDTLDHPKADNSKDIILTDSAIEVNVSL
ncbi:LRR receptor serine/threonine-protein kinase [Salix suchowensis]|nr:LRR receptor serine/threonine-protein kinase [Salix suchowensis]